MLSSTAKKNQRKYAYYHPEYGSKERNLRTHKRVKKVQSKSKEKLFLIALGLFLALCLTLVIPRVIISGNIKIAENNIAELNSQINSEQIKNSLMEREYMRRTSYSSIHQKALEAGMVEAQTRVNIPRHTMK